VDTRRSLGGTASFTMSFGDEVTAPAWGFTADASPFSSLTTPG
jgi:hypothetical protein